MHHEYTNYYVLSWKSTYHTPIQTQRDSKNIIRAFVVKIEMQENLNSCIRCKNRNARGQKFPNFKINVSLKPRPA